MLLLQLAAVIAIEAPAYLFYLWQGWQSGACLAQTDLPDSLLKPRLDWPPAEDNAQL